ncbi:hypothetical protein ES332_A06G220200v1 [Gossypium tomentosum]|uniref:Uncharacterized protein n=1 Tax=Gossypium tomentosum TaxID=34277 RepID=A0A5D2Q9K5_GOSTO|nr:hypothetical protein ES332_A06G220200v1 [Gossypium tomentosum]
MGVLVRPELYGSAVDLFELTIAKNPAPLKRSYRHCFNGRLHQPGIEPGSVPWQGTILPLDHWYLLGVIFKYPYNYYLIGFTRN